MNGEGPTRRCDQTEIDMRNIRAWKASPPQNMKPLPGAHAHAETHDDRPERRGISPFSGGGLPYATNHGEQGENF